MSSFFYFRPYIHVILPTVLLLIAAVSAAGQSTSTSEDASTANPVLRRIERARALAAAHQLQAAAAELENIRASANDVTVRIHSVRAAVGNPAGEIAQSVHALRCSPDKGLRLALVAQIRTHDHSAGADVVRTGARDGTRS